VFPKGTRTDITNLDLPESPPASGWLIRWMKYGIPKPEEVPPANSLIASLALPQSSPKVELERATKKPRLNGSTKTYADSTEYLLSRPSLNEDLFVRAKDMISLPNMGHSIDDVLPSRLVYIKRQDTSSGFDQSLWVFEIDSHASIHSSMPNDIGDLSCKANFLYRLPLFIFAAVIESGHLKYSSVYPALVNPESGQPLQFTTKNMPSTLDLKIKDPAVNVFVDSVRHHILLQLVKTGGYLPHSSDSVYLKESKVDNSLVLLKLSVDFRYKGLVVSPYLEVVNQQPISQCKEAYKEGTIVKLCPSGLYAEYIRVYASMTSAMELDKYMAQPKTRFNLKAETRHVDSARPEFELRLGCDLGKDEWLLCKWKDQEVIWPASLCLVER